MTKGTLVRFTLALCLAVAGLAAFLAWLGGAQREAHAAAPAVAAQAPAAAGSALAAAAPRQANGVGASVVVTVCKPSAGTCDYPSPQAAASGAAAGTIIKVAEGVYTDTDGDGYVLFITQTVTLEGGYAVGDWMTPDPNARPTVLDGGNGKQVVYIAAGVSPVVDGFHIRNGNIANGGGVYIASGTGAPTLQDNRIYDNAALNYGGGVYIGGGAPVVRRNRIYGNSAGNRGAGVYVAGGEPVIENNLIYANTTPSHGGGIYLSSGGGKVWYNVLYGNQANAGGGVYVGVGSTAGITACAIISNTAASGGGFYGLGVSISPQYNNVWGNTGGDYNVGFPIGLNDISLDPRFVDVSSADFRLSPDSPCIGGGAPGAYPTEDFDRYARPFGARADIGAYEFYTGACFARVGSGQIYTTVHEAVAAHYPNNVLVKVAGYCAGVHRVGLLSQTVYISYSLTLRGGYTITNWDEADWHAYTTTLDAQNAGRVIYIVDSAAATVEGFDIRGGAHVASNFYLGGGGIFVGSGDSVIRYNRIYSNTVHGGQGGGLALRGGNPAVYENEIYSNTVTGTGMGGGIGINSPGGNPSVERNQIHHNSVDNVSQDGGGGIGSTIPGGYTLTVRSNVIYSNTAPRGGGVSLGGGFADVEQNQIYSNAASYLGGGVYVRAGASGLVEGNDVFDNRVTSPGGSEGGGGVYVYGSGSNRVTVRRNTVYGNRVQGPRTDVFGGGIYAQIGWPNAAVIVIEANRVYTNSAYHGAGITAFPDDGEAYVRNNLVYDNWATGNGGGLMAWKGGAGELVVENNTFYRNGAGNGGGIFQQTSTPIIRSNVIAESVSGGGIANDGNATAPCDYCDIYNNTGGNGGGGTGSISADPLFVDAAAGNFRLQAASPCINAADPVNYPSDDAESYARPFGARADIGAHEYYTGACFARLLTNGWVYTNVQAAVISATTSGAPLPEVRVAGHCEGSVAISQSLVLRGGYSPTHWTSPVTPTTLVASAGQRVIYLTGANTSTVVIGELILTGGNATGDGGGVYVAAPLSPTIENVIFYNNTASGNGGAFASAGGNPRLFNNTVVSNSSGLYFATGEPVISNTIVADNTGNGIAAAGGVTATLAHNNVWGNGTNYVGLAAAATDISENPRFVNAAGGNFRLQPGSPCINMADAGTALTVDFEGDARPTPAGKPSDIGADEATAYLGVSLGPDRYNFADPGQVVKYTHYLTNTGTEEEVYDLAHTAVLSGSGDVNDWVVTYTPVYTLPAGGSTVVQVEVSVPVSATSDSLLTVYLTATARTNPDYFFDTAQGVLDVSREFRVDVSPDYSQSGNPGAVFVYLHTVTNNGNGPDTFRLNLGSSLGWATMDPPNGSTIALGSGLSAQVRVTVTIPNFAAGGALETTVVTATSLGSGGTVFDSAVDMTQANYMIGSRYVSPAGNDKPGGQTPNNCLLTTLPCRTIKQALEQAASDDVIKVAGGVYQEYNVTINKLVELRGGYNTAFTVQDWETNVTTIDAQQQGRVLYIFGNALVEGFTLRNGQFNGPGGGVYAVGSPILRHTIITNNVSLGGNNGGGVYNANGDTTLEWSSVLSNSAGLNGGGFYNARGNPVVQYSLFRDNVAGGRGGGLYNAGAFGAAPRVWSNVFYGNRAALEGGGFYNQAGDAQTLHNTFYANVNDAVSIASGAPVIQNSIIVSNTGRGVYSAVALTPDYNDVWSNSGGNYGGLASAGTHSISADPLFRDAPTGDFRLRDGSPCIEAGIAPLPAALKYDLEGQPRLMGDWPDMGADEFQKVAVEWIPSTDAEDGWPYQPMTYTHQLHNLGNYTDTFEVTWSNEWPGWDVTVNGVSAQPLLLTLGKNATTTVYVRMTPTNLFSGTTNTTIVTASSQIAAANPQAYDPIYATLVDTTTVNRAWYVELEPDRTGWGPSTAYPVVYVHTLTNTGNYTDSFTLSVVNDQVPPACTWGPLLVSPLNTGPLGQGMTTTVVVTVTVPPCAGVGTGIYANTAIVTATSDSSAGVYDTATDTTVSNWTHGVAFAADQNANGNTGATIYYSHILTNTGDYTDTFSLQAVSSQGWNVALGPQPLLTVGPGLTTTVRVTVTIPPLGIAFGDDVDRTVVTARSTTMITLSASVTDTTTVNRTTGALFVYNYDGSDFPPVRVENTPPNPDKQVVFVHTLTNVGNAPDTFDLNVAGSQPWALSISPSPTVTLGWQESITVLITVTVPAQAIVTPSPVDTIVAEATSHASPGSSDVVTDVVILNQVPGVTLSSDQAQTGYPGLRAPGWVTYTHRVTNTGSYTDSFALSASGWNVEFPAYPTNIVPDVPPGDGVTFLARVRVPFEPCGTLGTATITATSIYSNVYTDRLVDTTTVGAVYGVEIDDVGAVRALADGSGGVANYNHRLTSMGNCDGVFNLGAVQVDPNLTPSVTPPTVTLGYLTERNVQVTVNITPTLGGLWGNVVITAAGPGGSADLVTDTIVVNQEVDVSLTPDLTRTVYAAGAISYTHILTNEGNYTDTFALTGRNEHGWNVLVQPATSANVGPGSTRPVTVWVTVPANVYTITSRTLVTATSAVRSNEPTRVYSPTTSVVDTTIVRRPHVVIQPEPGYTLSVDPGVTRTLYHTLTNDGGLTGTYQLTYFLSAPWFTLVPTTVNKLPPGGQYPFTVSLQVPPASWNQGAQAVITATDLISGVWAVARDTITVPKRFDVNLFPAGVAYVQPPAVVTFYHTLENTGNYTTTYDLLIDGEFSDVSITPARVENLRWGETVPVTVVIQVPYRAAAGDSEDTLITIAFENQSVDFYDTVYISHTTGTRYVDVNGWDEENNCRESNAPCRTVQHAVDQASHGDEIHVAAGTYKGGSGASQVVNVNKSVALIGGYDVNDWAAGSDPVNNYTVLDAENRLGRRVVVVAADITPTIAGFHLRGGYVNGNGAGVYIETGASPTVRECVIYQNNAIGPSPAGGGLYYGGGGAPLLERNKIYENLAAGDGRGGGLYLAGGDARVWNNLVYYNTAAFGGGLYNAAGTPLVWNNTFYSNTVGDDAGGGGLYSQGGTLVVSNTIIAENMGTGIRVAGGSAPILAYNDVWGNMPADYNCAGCAHPTDISANPQFLNPAATDLHLTSASPCVNAGQPGVSQPSNDYEGNSRPIAGRYDIGAYEYGLGGSKTANPTAADPGAQVVYRILLANATTNPQYNIPITDTLHEYLAYVPGSLEYTGGRARYITATRMISWTGSVNPLGSVFITFTAEITGWLGSDVVITNTAWINYAPESAIVDILPAPSTRYVAPDGDDVDNGCNFAWRPCKTVQRAVDQALPGDEIKVATGVYSGSVPLVTVSKSVTLTGGFTWTRSYTSPVWTYAPELYPATLSGGVVISGPVAVTVDGFHIIGGQDGVRAYGGADLFLHRSWVYDNTRDGVRVENSAYRLVNNVIARNGQMGVRTTAGNGVLIHNTIARQTNLNMFGMIVNGSAVLTNTIFYQNTRGLRVDAGSVATLEATIWYQNGANQINGTLNPGVISLTGNPSFADPTNMDYHINGDSAAIDAGVDAGVDSDIDRDERPVLNGFDIGADEYPLRLIKVGPATAIAGQTITYSVSLQAKDPGLIITDVLPMHLTFTPGVDVVTCTVGTCGYLAAQNAITWTGDTRATGQVVITYTGSLTTWLAAGTVIPNTATMNRAGYIKQSPAWNTTIVAVPGVRYVASGGVDRDPATNTYNNCLVDWKPCATLQYAVDQAQAGDEIKVATGVYTDIHTVGGTTQIVRVGKNLTIRGGYTTTNWVESDPALRPTLLDAGGLGRVLYVAGPVTVTVDGLHLLRGSVAGDGGNVYVSGATLTLAHSRVYSGALSGSGREGGGVYADAATLTLEDTHVYANVAGNSAGGGVYSNGGTVSLNRAHIYRNTAASGAGNGGGVAGVGGVLNVTDSQVYGNTAGGYGGGIYLDSANVTVAESQFYANSSAFGGGGLYLRASDVALVGNHVYTNTTSSSGGGVAMYICPDVLLDANVIIDNAGGAAPTANGGGVYLFGDNTTLTMTNNIVAANRIGGGGDGVYLASNFGTANSAKFYHNTLADNDGEGLRVDAFGFTVDFQNSIVVGQQKGIVTSYSTAFVTGGYGMAYGNTQFQDNSLGGVIFITPLYTEDPLFRDRPGRDYHITFGSPAVDRCPGVDVLHDVDGDARPLAALYDIGADELNIEVQAAKYADPDPVEAGATVTYTIYVTNTGGVNVHATITDTLPPQLTATDPLTWSDVFIGYGEVWSATVRADVAWGYTGTLTNVVKVTTQEGARDTYTATSQARVTPALALFKQADPDPVESGATVTYTIYVTNTGNVTLTVSLTDVLPAELTALGPTSWVAMLGQANPVWTTTLAAAVAWNYSGTLTNTLLATSDWGAAAIYTATSQARVTPAFAVDKQAALDLVEAGKRLTYTVRLTNTGNVDIIALLTDTLPAQVTTTQPLTWTAVVTAPGGLWEATLVVNVAEGYDGPIVNRVDVTANSAITAWAGVDVTATAFETTTVKGPPSLTIAKTANPPVTVLPGGLLVYRLVVANGGPGVATAPLIRDVRPANTTFQSCSGGSACGYHAASGVVTWTAALLPAGAQLPVTFTVQVGSSVLSGTVIANQSYTVTCAEGESAVGAPVSVRVGASGGVAVSTGRVQTVLPGNQVVYTHRVTNTTNAPQTVDVTFSSTRGWAQVAPTTLSALAANGGAATVRVTVTVPSGAAIGTEDVTTITATGRLRGQATATDRTTVGCAGVFNADFTFSPAAPKAGQAVVFTGTVGVNSSLPLNYTWNFGDLTAPVVQSGVMATTSSVQHTFAAEGVYTAVLTVTNVCGSSVAAPQRIEVAPAGFDIYLPVVLRNS